MTQAIDVQALRAKLGQANPPALLHVLPDDVFAALRLPGSLNACVYEAAFLDKVAGLLPDKQREIVVYGAGAGSLDARDASEKLEGAGYAHVWELPGGLEALAAGDVPLEGSQALPEAVVLDGTFRLNAGDSTIRWTGRNPANHHHGTVGLKDGEVYFEGGRLVSARFAVDMGAIANEDLTDPGMNAVLIHHLNSRDFFDVANHPTAEFLLDTAEPVAADAPGHPNTLYRLSGLLTLRGVTRPVSLVAQIGSANGQRVTGQGMIELDRTDFGALYGSNRFFRFLGQHVVNELVQLHVKLHADRVL